MSAHVKKQKLCSKKSYRGCFLSPKSSNPSAYMMSSTYVCSRTTIMSFLKLARAARRATNLYYWSWGTAIFRRRTSRRVTFRRGTFAAGTTRRVTFRRVTFRRSDISSWDFSPPRRKLSKRVCVLVTQYVLAICTGVQTFSNAPRAGGLRPPGPPARDASPLDP